MNKYNYIYYRDGKRVIFSVTKEVDNHLKRHLDIMCNGRRDNDNINNWLVNRGYESELLT